MHILFCAEPVRGRLQIAHFTKIGPGAQFSAIQHHQNVAKQLIKKIFQSIPLLLAGIIGTLSCALGSDVLREAQFAREIRTGLEPGQALTIEADGRSFFAIQTQAITDPALGTVILLHGLGMHPDWADVIHPLRTTLPEHGWSTLSIQLPVSAPGVGLGRYAQRVSEALPRIQAAIDFTAAQGGEPVILTGHGLGALMAMAFLTQNPDAGVEALVAIGVTGFAGREGLDSIELAGGLSMPVLDIFGSADLAPVVAAADARRAAAQQAGNEHYRQIEVTGADHRFSQQATSLTKRVRSWLHKTFKP